MKFIATFVLFVVILRNAYAQCGPPATSNCAPFPASQILLSGSDPVYFSFTDFNQYYGGITYSGATTLRLKVDSLNATCKWSLKMIVDNNPAATAIPTEWETLYSYGAGTTAPLINALNVRVYNGCNTPLMSGIYQSFPGSNASVITLIDDVSLNPAGTCGTNVNGYGSYITNYNEFTFTIDYRITPGLTFSPGIYQLTIRFCLVEDT